MQDQMRVIPKNFVSLFYRVMCDTSEHEPHLKREKKRVDTRSVNWNNGSSLHKTCFPCDKNGELVKPDSAAHVEALPDDMKEIVVICYCGSKFRLNSLQKHVDGQKHKGTQKIFIPCF